MTNSELGAQIQKTIEKLAKTAATHHATGDLAAKVALTAPDRRTQRNAQNVNRTCRAVGEAVGASLWLLGVVGKEKAMRGVPAERALPAINRLLADAVVLAGDLEFEAHIAMRYEPQQAKRSSRGRT